MKKVILSSDGEAAIYLVPEEVADNLEKYCSDFAANWVRNGPDKSKFLEDTEDGEQVAIFNESDFIDYLNRWAFPNERSELVRNLGCYFYEIPEEYADYPEFNF